MATRKSRVAYFYKQDIGSYYYGPGPFRFHLFQYSKHTFLGHPMKPHRLRLTHHLLLTYGMYRKMEVLRPHAATAQELERAYISDSIVLH